MKENGHIYQSLNNLQDTMVERCRQSSKSEKSIHFKMHSGEKNPGTQTAVRICTGSSSPLFMRTWWEGLHRGHSWASHTEICEATVTLDSNSVWDNESSHRHNESKQIPSWQTGRWKNNLRPQVLSRIYIPLPVCWELVWKYLHLFLGFWSVFLLKRQQFSCLQDNPTDLWEGHIQ